LFVFITLKENLNRALKSLKRNHKLRLLKSVTLGAYPMIIILFCAREKNVVKNEIWIVDLPNHITTIWLNTKDSENPMTTRENRA